MAAEARKSRASGATSLLAARTLSSDTCFVPVQLAGQVVDGQPRPDPTLIKALKTAHRLLAEAGDAPIAVPDRAVLRASPVGPYERGLLRLAFLAPDLQTQILEGRQPAGLTLQRVIASELPPVFPAGFPVHRETHLDLRRAETRPCSGQGMARRLG